jgi:hypothetical protein
MGERQPAHAGKGDLDSVYSACMTMPTARSGSTKLRRRKAHWVLRELALGVRRDLHELEHKQGQVRQRACGTPSPIPERIGRRANTHLFADRRRSAPGAVGVCHNVLTDRAGAGASQHTLGQKTAS